MSTTPKPLTFLPYFDGIEVELVLMRGGKELPKGSKANAQHWYRVTGFQDLLPSVTTIHKPIMDKSGPLVGWARNTTRDAMQSSFLSSHPSQFGEGTYKDWVESTINKGWNSMWEKSSEGADAGTTAHELIAQYINDHAGDVAAALDEAGRIQEDHPELGNAVVAGLRFLDVDGLQPVAVELAVYHPQFLYAGTIDLVGRDPEGVLTVVDWKRVKGRLYPEHDFQIAAYAATLQVLTGEDVHPCVVRLPQESEGEEIGEARYLTAAEANDALRVHLTGMDYWRNLTPYIDAYEKARKAAR